MTVEQHVNLVEAFKPDAFEALCDSASSLSNQPKRIKKSVDRTLSFLDQTLALRAESRVSEFGGVGSWVLPCRLVMNYHNSGKFSQVWIFLQNPVISWFQIFVILVSMFFPANWYLTTPLTVHTYVFTALLACFMAAGLIELAEVSESWKDVFCCHKITVERRRHCQNMCFFARVKILASWKVCSSYFCIYTIGVKKT